ncbi:hypothetical protein CBR_g20045 [Chara braunii]|uniref:Bifunctional inhibitor/plant lipid transfer protein/seed storage helical domain-containing protein n=1 Tax=Chara braunii TaxID=69332 RepID=A0A388KZD1_CHABU|nr:hypothetical protein CBR_g20045 [Chara braunii]|eukprot:GBG75415.1 hypothetical protein CBR_g20045 [Chara braunii]
MAQSSSAAMAATAIAMLLSWQLLCPSAAMAYNMGGARDTDTAEVSSESTSDVAAEKTTAADKQGTAGACPVQFTPQVFSAVRQLCHFGGDELCCEAIQDVAMTAVAYSTKCLPSLLGAIKTYTEVTSAVVSACLSVQGRSTLETLGTFEALNTLKFYEMTGDELQEFAPPSSAAAPLLSQGSAN